MRIHNGETLVECMEARREGDFMEPKAVLYETEKAIGFEGEDDPIFLPKSQIHLVRKDERLFLWIMPWLFEKKDEISDIITR